VTVQQQGAAEPIHEKRKLRLDRRVIGTVCLCKTLIELLGADCPAPQIAMLLSSRWDNSQAAPSPCGDSAATSAVDN
jgi:hypothetical protein